MQEGPIVFWGLVLFFGVLLFVALRTLLLWYWRVDEQVALLREIRDSLRRIEGAPEPTAKHEPATSPAATLER